MISSSLLFWSGNLTLSDQRLFLKVYQHANIGVRCLNAEVAVEFFSGCSLDLDIALGNGRLRWATNEPILGAENGNTYLVALAEL